MAVMSMNEERYYIRENAMRAIVRLSLTADEYKVLMHLVLGSCPSPSTPGALWLIDPIDVYAERSGYLPQQFYRIMSGLELHGITHGLREDSSCWVIHGMPTGPDDDPNFSYQKINKKDTPPGWVYVIHAKETKWYKIGISKDVERRATELSAKAPFDVEIVMSQRYPSTTIARRIETKLHTKFGAYRKNGEWFELNDNCLERLRDELGLIPIDMQQIIG